MSKIYAVYSGGAPTGWDDTCRFYGLLRDKENAPLVRKYRHATTGPVIEIEASHIDDDAKEVFVLGGRGSYVYDAEIISIHKTYEEAFLAFVVIFNDKFKKWGCGPKLTDCWPDTVGKEYGILKCSIQDEIFLELEKKTQQPEA
jgi:hypothetical protein